MPGAIINNTVETVSIAHWGWTDGTAVGTSLGIKVEFINDFEAAAYGVARLKAPDCISIGKSGENKLYEGKNSVKIVIGPGTGLG